MRAADARLATLFEPMFGVTFTPTRISASEKINVIPSRAQLKVDCRVPPGLGEREVRAGIAEVLGDCAGGVDGAPADGEDAGARGAVADAAAPDAFEIEFTESVTGNASPLGSPLMDALAAWVSEHDPGARVVPVVLPGFTDSRHFRLAFPDCVAYGFFPQRHQSLLEGTPLIHGADERVDVRDLELGANLYAELAQRLLG
jgi:acetylornithine deacetylase/succinyl-diaminopimelate desuccinylase-like protein